MSIQIYALKRNFDVQKAERFFKERRVPYQLLDLKKHKLGQREMALFVRRLGAQSLVGRIRTRCPTPWRIRTTRRILRIACCKTQS